MKQIDLKDQYFGTEIEMTGISRYDAAVAIGRMFGTEPYHIRSYDSWCVKDSDGKTWKFSRDSSIDCERLANGTVIDADGDYSTEMVSPKLEYSEMGKLQEVVRCVKNAGAFVNSSCGMHVHVDASNHTPSRKKGFNEPYRICVPGYQTFKSEYFGKYACSSSGCNKGAGVERSS